MGRLKGKRALITGGTPTEFAKVVVFLASDESAFTVASELLIDGGMSGI